MNHQGTIELQTSRLRLRRVCMDDAQAMYTTWTSDPEVAKFMRWQPHSSSQETSAIIAQWIQSYESPSFYLWLITLKETNQPIGSIGLFIVNEFDEVGDVGYCLGKAFWWNGYASEALAAVIHYAFTSIHFNRIETYHSIQNPASGKVMKKVGMSMEGLAKQKYKSIHGFQDCVCYAILREEYLQTIKK